MKNLPRFNLLILVGIMILFFACQKTKNTTSFEGVQFFDLKNYFEQEQQRLANTQKIKKRVTIDEKIEEKVVDYFNTEEEFVIFIDSDINKVSWYDKYEVDSLFEDNNLTQIDYKAKDDQLKTSNLSIHFQNNQVDSISILRKTTSMAATLKQQLNYMPSKGYSIVSSQSTSLADSNVLRLDVFFEF